ncbi:MAG: alpha/beta hydrolase [Gammaproteobacteria bacterium]|nr:alpha/beta hydrolase [Gammaproteobacteria bacterium]
MLQMPVFYQSETSRLPLRSLLLVVFLVLPTSASSDPPEFDLDHPPGRMVDVGGYRLHIYCLGQGSPAVILDAGLGGFSMDWMYVQERLRVNTQVCAYDRAGYGWSDPGPSPRSSDQIAEELWTLLSAAEIEPPYVLVGHSFGGYNMEYFAKTRPRAVAGLVLVDASHPEQAERLPDVPTRANAPDPRRLVTFFNPTVVYVHYPKPLWFPIMALMSSPKAMATEQRELLNFTVSAAQVEQAGQLPQVPLIVVTRGRRVWPDGPMGDAKEKSWGKLQQELVESVPGGRQIIAPNSGHLIHLDEPDVVAGAVREVLRRSCGVRMAQDAQPEYALAC